MGEYRNLQHIVMFYFWYILFHCWHSSHFKLNAVCSVAERVLNICLVPYTTSHWTQVVLALWRCCEWGVSPFLSRNHGRVVTWYQLSELFGRAWMRGITITITSWMLCIVGERECAHKIRSRYNVTVRTHAKLEACITLRYVQCGTDTLCMYIYRKIACWVH